jgi:radical SAM superfamily enzyme YgiQ (UPF0313 family)
MNRVLLVAPAAYDEHGQLVKSRIAHAPYRVLPLLAALTPPQYRVKIIEESVEPIDFDCDADLIALTSMVRHVPRAIDISRAFRRRGKKTVIGGIAAYALADKIEGEFDSIVQGEADDIWPEVLSDFSNNRLKPRYEAASKPDLKSVPFPRYDLVNPKHYIRPPNDPKRALTIVETSRGCPRNCSYCLVNRYFGRKLRYRPVGQVIDEIKHHGAKLIFFSDDNFGINVERTKEIIRHLVPLNIRWTAQFDHSVARHPDLLALARDSGCIGGIVGVESLDPENLRSVNKNMASKIPFEELAGAFAEYDVPLFANMIFGLDHDTPQSVVEAYRRVAASHVAVVYPWILTPTPRTPLHDQIKKEGRILHDNYSIYDHWHAVFQPRKMTPRQLERAFWKGCRKFYSWRKTVKVFRDHRYFRFHLATAHSYYRRLVQQGRHPIGV